MTNPAMISFMESVGNDEALAAELLAATEGKSVAEATQAVADLATRSGHAVSFADAKAARRQALENLGLDADLADRDLDAVSGGIDPVTGITISAIGLGVTGTLLAGLVGGSVVGGTVLGGSLIANGLAARPRR